MSVYAAPTYKAFLRSELDGERYGRGSRSRLAGAVGVPMSFLSAVLNGKRELTAEHALKAARFLGLEEAETEFFVLLLGRDRAGSKDLRDHFDRQLARRLEHRREIASRVRRDAKLKEAELFEYYESWRHVAIHLALRIPEYRDLGALGRALGLSIAEVRASIATLARLGLVRTVQGRPTPTESLIHVGRASKALRLHHANWRAEATRSLARATDDDLHYSAVMSIDAGTAAKIKRLLVKAVESAEPAIRAAPDETLVAWTMDLFRVATPG